MSSPPRSPSEVQGGPGRGLRSRLRPLAHREELLRELMDDPACDPAALRRTYAQFPLVNAVVAGWRAVYMRRLRPLLSAHTVTTVLDVGCGGGDVARRLARWARRDGLLLHVTAVDPDPRAFAYLRGLPATPGVLYRHSHSSELVAEGARFDVVLSNHLLHHLSATELDTVLQDSARLATRLVLHSDIARSPIAYALFAVATLPLAVGSFIWHDGLISIRRSYTPAELRRHLPPGWTVTAAHPFRTQLSLLPAVAGTGPEAAAGTAVPDHA